jgi:major membrane immunogen (membrane-anchored lipoprotein)
MKKSFLVLTALSIFMFNACAQQKGPYIDGIYNGKSQADYTYEPYVGYVAITIKNGWPIKADFKIIDTTKNEIFNNLYEKNFEGNDHYINQCRNDWKGVQTYPVKLIENQSLEKVDAISGATWSYNFFKYATQEALKNAKK